MIPRAGISLDINLACLVTNLARIMSWHSWHSWQTARSRMWRSRVLPANLSWRRSFNTDECFWMSFNQAKSRIMKDISFANIIWCYLWLTICMPRISEGALLAYLKLKIVANDLCAMAVMQFQQVKPLRLFHCWNGWLRCGFPRQRANPETQTIAWAGSAGESCDWQGPKGLPRHFAGHDC